MKEYNFATCRYALIAAVMCVLLCCVSSPAAVISIGAAKDNTLYESATGDFSNGAGEYLFIGRTAQGTDYLRRGLLAFDIAGNIPSGSTINSVTLTLYCSKSVSDSYDASLHKTLVNWGESNSDAGEPGGTGAPAASGDATWVHTFSPGSVWTTPGGDFTGAASATTSIGFADLYYTWGPTPEMAADVQGWLDNPSSNFGWVLIGNETDIRSAKRLDTRENAIPELRPKLTIDYTIPFIAGDMNCDAMWTIADVDPFVQALLDPNAYISQHPGCSLSRGDLNGDTFVDGEDIGPMVEGLIP